MQIHYVNNSKRRVETFGGFSANLHINENDIESGKVFSLDSSVLYRCEKKDCPNHKKCEENKI
ncbi:MAG: hypothetical protein IJ638_00150, partial [Alphaproteobacteria bacterium]|nr:hypothetical protein [Alphaproteobacteria bacterium]